MQERVSGATWLDVYLSRPSVSFDAHVGLPSRSCRRVCLDLGTKIEVGEEEERIHHPPPL